MNNQEKMLQFILDELNKGNTFGRYYVTGQPTNSGDTIKIGYWLPVLYKTQGDNIGYTYHGFSAKEFTTDGLKWIIQNIFKISVGEFLAKYTVEIRH